MMIHPTAIVDPGAQIGEGTRVWHWVHVCAGARIGRKCSLGQNVYVGNDVAIGDNVKIQNNVSVYDAVTLEDDVFCGPSMVFTNVYNPRSAIVRKDQLRRTLVRKGATLGANCTIVCGITIGQYAFVGAGAVVNRDVPDFALMLGVPARHAFVGAGAVVNRDVPDFALMLGVPARQAGWMSRFGERLELPAKGDGEAVCPHTGERYRVTAGRCWMVPPA
jgi:UDP-2-acetamido-3-amino-2,3-dideoxy-glucuronate N-acetyltransferase